MAGGGDAGGVFKLVGPALVRQDPLEARSNVGKRLEFIRRELERLGAQSDTLSEKHARKQQQVRRRYALPPPPPPLPSPTCGQRHVALADAAASRPSVVPLDWLILPRPVMRISFLQRLSVALTLAAIIEWALCPPGRRLPRSRLQFRTRSQSWRSREWRANGSSAPPFAFAVGHLAAQCAMRRVCKRVGTGTLAGYVQPSCLPVVTEKTKIRTPLCGGGNRAADQVVDHPSNHCKAAT